MDRIEQIKSFLLKTPDDAFLNYALAIEYVAKQWEDEALKQFIFLVETMPNYHATYYHLAKLYERLGNEELAISTYEKGMEITKMLNEKHAFGELKSAYEELIF